MLTWIHHWSMGRIQIDLRRQYMSEFSFHSKRNVVVSTYHCGGCRNHLLVGGCCLPLQGYSSGLQWRFGHICESPELRRIFDGTWTRRNHFNNFTVPYLTIHASNLHKENAANFFLCGLITQYFKVANYSSTFHIHLITTLIVIVLLIYGLKTFFIHWCSVALPDIMDLTPWHWLALDSLGRMAKTMFDAIVWYRISTQLVLNESGKDGYQLSFLHTVFTRNVSSAVVCVYFEWTKLALE